MKTPHAVSATFVTITILLASATANAATAKVPANVDLAAKAMYAAATMESSSKSTKMSTRGSNGCKSRHFPKKGRIYCKNWYRDFKEDISYVVAVYRNVMYVSIRGTDKSLRSNKLMNANAYRAQTQYGKVHTGWWLASNKVWKRLKNTIARYGKGRKVIITGHSMGGAVAAYVTRHALSYSKTKNLQLRLVTFGAPRYSHNPYFFPAKKSLYVYTVENLYKRRAKGRWIADPIVHSWRVTGGAITPPDGRKRIWSKQCRTTKTNSSDAHAARTYYDTGTANRCHIS